MRPAVDVSERSRRSMLDSSWHSASALRWVASSPEGCVVSDLKIQLWSRLRGARSRMQTTLNGLSEYDLRRPLTPTGTNLLGLVKHLAGEEYGYLGGSFGRHAAEAPSWFRDDPHNEIDMWATPNESSGYIIGVYRAACAHSDCTIGELHLHSPGHVPHWSERPGGDARDVVGIDGWRDCATPRTRRDRP